MEAEIKKSENANIGRYKREDVELARQFVKKIYGELGNFVKAAVLFGSSARSAPKTEAGDIDILIIVDDVTIALSPELIETYRIIVEKSIAAVSEKIHATSLKFTSFWEYVRAGDPVAINILRDGVALMDSGFFDPLQVLLLRGRIRPTPEAIVNYFMRAPNTIHNSKWHVMQAAMNLYWAAIDSAHAALMQLGETPPSPAHVADLIDKRLVPKGLDKKYVNIMRSLYDLYKGITYRKIPEIRGQDYDRYLKETQDFVKEMRKFVQHDIPLDF